MHTDVEGSWSAVGTDCRKVKKDKATMMLDLKNYPRDFQKYLIVHQFGHALGMEHEHQRQDFWNAIKKHIDKDKIKNDRNIGNYRTVEAIERDWFPLETKSHRESVKEYDPQSVMHWW